MLWTYVWTLLIYWMAIFVSCFVVTEVAQDQLYNLTTPRIGLKITLGSLFLAILMVLMPPSYQTMFTCDIAWTVLHLFAWFGVFTFILQFHPPHALGLSLATFFLVSGFATMGVNSILKPTPRAALAPARSTNKPVRQSLGPSAPPAAKGKAAEKAK